VLLVQTSLERHHVTAELDLTPGAPPVVGDRVQLQQVMLNLVMNGIEAMTHVSDGPRRLVISSTVTESGQVEARVTDAGTGVAAPDLARLFDPFFTTKPTGMGLGLSVSRSIVESHGGRLWASNNAGSGATFHFTLPAAVAS
jgi:signal transduction histidine kinase